MGLSADVSVESARADFLEAPAFSPSAAPSHPQDEPPRGPGSSATDGMETDEVHVGEGSAGRDGAEVSGSARGPGEGDESMEDAKGEGEGSGGKGAGQAGCVPSASGAHIVYAAQFKARFSVS